MGLLGAHVSISGGVENSISRGEELGCDAIQIFSKNQRQWKSSTLSDESVKAFREAFGNSRIKKITIHDSYLINLASPDTEILEKSRRAFLDEMERADRLGVPYLVFHPGSHMKTNEGEGIHRIAESLNYVLTKLPDKRVQLLLETTAGQGDHLGYTFEQLADIIFLIKQKERVGICYDTAHAFAAGYDIRTEKSYEETLTQFEQIVELDHLKVFHLNDSKSDLGSRVDRHENIGKGYLGYRPFQLLVNDSRFKDHAMILETPEGDKYYRDNLTLLRSFIE